MTLRTRVLACILAVASSALAMPTSTSSASAAAGSQIRTDQDPVYHLYIQSTPLEGAPVLGPESSSGWFTIGNTIQDTNSSLFLNVDMSPTTSYKPLTLDETATTTTWSLSGDTIINDGQQNFVVCAIDGSENWNLFLQTGRETKMQVMMNFAHVHSHRERYAVEFMHELDNCSSSVSVLIMHDRGYPIERAENATNESRVHVHVLVVIVQMPYDPVRDAVLNSPLTRSYPLPISFSSTSPTHSSSPQTPYYLPNNNISSGASSSSVSAAAAAAAANAPIQSPSSSRRATDLSVLLNADDQVPMSPFQRRPSSSGSVVASPSLSTGTPHHRSAHLSHILQPNSDDGSPSPRFASGPPPSLSAATTSPSASPLSRNREILGPSLFRSRAPSHAAALGHPSSQQQQQPDSLRRASSSSASGPKSESRSPEMPRTPLSNTSTLAAPDLPVNMPSPPMHRPTRQAIPYAPRNRRTAPGSVLVPLSEDERQFYKNLSKNPLKETKLGKRKFEDMSNDTLLPRGRDEPPAKLTRDVGLVVKHYNLRPDVGVTQRQQSPIIGLKSFNNWVKSVLIARFAHPALHPDEKNGIKKGEDGKVQFSGAGRGRVLDMGCGKGGDLNKWQKAKVGEYVGVDIAEISVEQARLRYQSSAAANPLKTSSRFNAFFAAIDCYTHSLSEIPNIPIPPRTPPFDVVSMQFCMHYAFETVQKARVMLENVTRWLRKGGRFVGTIPNDRLLLERLDALPADQDRSNLSFGNSVYRVRFEDRERRPVFGHRYYFFLRDAVEDIPEYVVHWDNFVQMASEYHLKLLYKKEFHDVYAEHCEHPEYAQLLQKMRVVDANGESQMDEDQWEAANVYVAFAFEKV